MGTLSYLKELGLPLDDPDHSGRTPLLAMLAKGPIAWGENRSHDLRAKAELLLDAGADALATDQRGNTALHYAVEHGLDDIRDRLIATGVDPLQVNLDGVNPKQRAEKGRLVTFHSPKAVDEYHRWADQCDMPLSDLVHAALTLHKSCLGNLASVDEAHGSTFLPHDGDSWFEATMFPLIDGNPFDPRHLSRAFRAAISGGMQRVVDHCLLQECLCIEMAGPERGYLVTAVETYTRNLLAAGCSVVAHQGIRNHIEYVA